MQQSIIITSDQGEPVVCSLVLAEGLGIAHRALIATVRKHLKSVEEFGRVLFRKAPLKTGGGTQRVTLVDLNENQALFVGSLSENTAKVVAFKVTLIQEFDRARKAIARAAHVPQTGLVQLVNTLTDKVISLEAKIDQLSKGQATYFTAQRVADQTAEAIEDRVKRERIITFVRTTIHRSLGASWSSFWDKFDQSYNADIRGLEKRKNELTIDTAIRHGYLNQLWEFVNIQ